MLIQKKLFLQAYQAMQQAERIMIVAHQKPDGDTSGSALALWHYLTGLGKQASVFCRTQLADQFVFLPGSDAFTNDPTIFEQPWDLIVVCDSGDLAYAGIAEYMERLPAKPMIINFDHHASNLNYGDLNLVDPRASSTAEVVFCFFQVNEIELDDLMAKCLLTAVFTDTGGFSNAATNTRSLEMAAHFVGQGASIPEVHGATITNKNLEALKLWGKVFSRLHYADNGDVYTYILLEDLNKEGLDVEAVDGISNYLSHLKEARAIIVYHEKPGGLVKASLRTYRDDVDLSKHARSMGGGGHRKAAGYTVPGKITITTNGVTITST